MPETVLLTIRCVRRRCLIAKIVDDDGERAIEAPRYAAGRTYHSWTPARFPFVAGDGHRYGCRCRSSRLLRNERFTHAIRDGVTELTVR